MIIGKLNLLITPILDALTAEINTKNPQFDEEVPDLFTWAANRDGIYTASYGYKWIWKIIAMRISNFSFGVYVIS